MSLSNRVKQPNMVVWGAFYVNNYYYNNNKLIIFFINNNNNHNNITSIIMLSHVMTVEVFVLVLALLQALLEIIIINSIIPNLLGLVSIQRFVSIKKKLYK